MASIIFGTRMRNSYHVFLPQGFKFNNDRVPHVKTDQEILPGSMFVLGRRSEQMVKGDVAVMYDVIGVKDGNSPAHLTVYFGPKCEESDKY